MSRLYSSFQIAQSNQRHPNGTNHAYYSMILDTFECHGLKEEMATYVTSRQQVFQNENSEALPKKAMVDGKSKIPKTTTKKGGLGKGSRKALNDITNKSTIRPAPQASVNKKKVPEEEFNFAEEGFLHDHIKCTETQQKAMQPSFLDIVFPGYDSYAQTLPTEAESKNELHSPRYYPEPVELPMHEFSDWLKPSTRCDSPLSSPINWDSPPCSPLAWHFEPVEFELKKERLDV